MRKRIEEELLSLGFTPVYRGFDYWCDLIEMLLENDSERITNAYKNIKEKRNAVSSYSVEVGLRHSIGYATRNLLIDYCNGETNITVKVLAGWIKFKLRRELENEED